MTYIIENANVLDDQAITTTHFLIKQNKIASRPASVNKLTHIRMDAKSFIMTPTSVMFNQQVPEDMPFHQLKQYFLDSFIKKGCTTLLTTAQIQLESEFLLKIKQKRSQLNTSPIDYIIGVKIPVQLLTPSFIRKCKKEKIPVVFVKIDDLSELSSIPWGWVREAMFPYNAPLVPIFGNRSSKELIKSTDLWRKITANEKIPSLQNELTEFIPIAKQDLAKIGIYPLKSNLLHGGELSYNMYLMGNESRQVEEMSLFHYHNHRLVLTMHKGKMIRVGDKTSFCSGFGEQVMINKPSFYSF